MTLAWYYIWSDDYRVFHELLKDSVKDSELLLKPIEIPQARVDSIHKSMMKIDMILGSLDEAARASQPYILFTDVDIIVKPGLYESLKPYMEDRTDMVFLNDNKNLHHGCLLLRVCDETIFFWKELRETMVIEPGNLQTYVNRIIERFKGSYTTFDDQIITSSNTWNQTADFKILLCRSSQTTKEFNMAEKIFTAAQLVDLQPYMVHVPETVIDHIYKFQEIMYSSYQEAKKEMR